MITYGQLTRGTKWLLCIVSFKKLKLAKSLRVFPVRDGSAKTGLMKILKIILNRIFTSNRNFSGKGGNPFPV